MVVKMMAPLLTKTSINIDVYFKYHQNAAKNTEI